MTPKCAECGGLCREMPNRFWQCDNENSHRTKTSLLFFDTGHGIMAATHGREAEVQR